MDRFQEKGFPWRDSLFSNRYKKMDFVTARVLVETVSTVFCLCLFCIRWSQWLNPESNV